MVPDSVDLIYNFINFPRTDTQDKYSKFQNNVIHMYLVGTANVSHVYSSIISDSCSNNDAAGMIKNQIEHYYHFQPETTIKNGCLKFGRFKFKMCKHMFGKLVIGVRNLRSRNTATP